MCTFVQAAFADAYWAINSLKVFSATDYANDSSTGLVGQRGVNNTSFGNSSERRKDAAANTTDVVDSAGVKRLLQDDLRAPGDLQIHVHREPRECLLHSHYYPKLLLWF